MSLTYLTASTCVMALLSCYLWTVLCGWWTLPNGPSDVQPVVALGLWSFYNMILPVDCKFIYYLACLPYSLFECLVLGLSVKWPVACALQPVCHAQPACPWPVVCLSNSLWPGCQCHMACLPYGPCGLSVTWLVCQRTCLPHSMCKVACLLYNLSCHMAWPV